MVDDKLRILAAMKQVWKERLTTIFPRQGHHALDPHNLAAYPAAATFDFSALLGAKAGAGIGLGPSRSSSTSS
jgi:hypothetical protein